MKNMVKKTVCTLTLAAVCTAGSVGMASTAFASGHDVQDVYVSDSICRNTSLQRCYRISGSENSTGL